MGWGDGVPQHCRRNPWLGVGRPWFRNLLPCEGAHPKVHHQATRTGDSLWEPDGSAFYSVAVKFRMASVCATRPRAPPELLKCLAQVFRGALADLPWRMPTLAERSGVQEAQSGAQGAEATWRLSGDERDGRGPLVERPWAFWRLFTRELPAPREQISKTAHTSEGGRALR